MEIKRWELLLEGAVFYSKTDSAMSEFFFRKAQEYATSEAGANSMAFALASDHFAEFLTNSGRQSEAQNMEQQARNILRNYASNSLCIAN